MYVFVKSLSHQQNLVLCTITGLLNSRYLFDKIELSTQCCSSNSFKSYFIVGKATVSSILVTFF